MVTFPQPSAFSQNGSLEETAYVSWSFCRSWSKPLLMSVLNKSYFSKCVFMSLPIKKIYIHTNERRGSSQCKLHPFAKSTPFPSPTQHVPQLIMYFQTQRKLHKMELWLRLWLCTFHKRLYAGQCEICCE